MSLSAKAHSIPGTLRQEAVIDGQRRLITDKPQHLGGDGVAVEHDNRSTPRAFHTAIELGGRLSDEQLRRLVKVAASGPVRRSVEAGIEFHETIACRAHPAAHPLVNAAGRS